MKYSVIILVLCALLLLISRNCRREWSPDSAWWSTDIPIQPSLPDTIVSHDNYIPPILKRPDLPVLVTLHPVDSILRKQAEKKPIITDIKKKTVKKLFKKQRHYVEFTRIDTLAKPHTLTYELISPEVDYTITPEGLETDPKSIKKIKRKIFWRKVGNTAKDIGKVGGGAAAAIIIIKSL